MMTFLRASASFLHSQHFARDLRAHPCLLRRRNVEVLMLTWRQIYCDIHGQGHLIWIDNSEAADSPLTVICTKCAERKIADASFKLAEEYAANVSGMVILGSTKILSGFENLSH